MLPSIFGENLFDDFFGDSFEKEFFGNRNPVFGKHGKNMMKTDVKELEDCYELDVDLPGFQKDEVNVSVQDGYLTIQASKNLDRDKAVTSARNGSAVLAAAASMWATCSPIPSMPNTKMASCG